jgi:hypothetical protein
MNESLIELNNLTDYSDTERQTFYRNNTAATQVLSRPYDRNGNRYNILAVYMKSGKIYAFKSYNLVRSAYLYDVLELPVLQLSTKEFNNFYKNIAVHSFII